MVKVKRKPSGKQPIVKKKGRPVGSKNKTDQITIGQLALRIMDCMSELRRQAEGLTNVFQSINQLVTDVNNAHGKVVKQVQVVEAKTHELEKLVLGRISEISDNSEVEQ